MSTSTYRVSGMRCDHCVQSVRDEVAKIPGVTEVEVVLEGGEVTVLSDQALDDESVRAAITEAGYKLET